MAHAFKTKLSRILDLPASVLFVVLAAIMLLAFLIGNKVL